MILFQKTRTIMLNIENKENIFTLHPPKNKYIGILSLPHSGEVLPDEFKQYLSDDWNALMRDVDYKVHELIDIDLLQKAGIAVIKSHIIRTAVDLNRAQDNALLNWKQNSFGEQVVEQEPSDEIAQELTLKYYSPYYEMLKALINDLKSHSQKPSFIDLHSMPSKPTAYHLKITPNQKMHRPDFCISDVKGISCEKEFIDYVCSQLKETYSEINQNDPYFGGHVTRHVNSQFTEVNNIQIEINRNIYMDEPTKTLDIQKIEKLKPALTDALIKTFETFFEKYSH